MSQPDHALRLEGMDTPRESHRAFHLTDAQVELLEQYIAEGSTALRDPAVAAFVAEHGAWLAEVDDAFVTLRRPLRVPPPRPIREARRPAPRVGRSARSAWQPLVLGVAGVCLAVTGWLVGSTRRSSTVEPATFQTFQANAGERASVRLADGTRILLNAGSVVRVPRDLSVSRTVSLEGEALFTVAHDGRIPFVVQAGAAQVTVLGTTFAVRRYPDEHAARVAVVDGRVAVRATRARLTGEAVLDARTVGEVSDSGRIVVTSDVDVRAFTQWTTDALVFRNAPLRDVLPVLARRYGLTIRLADSTLANERVTTRAIDEAPSAVLDDIAATLGIRYVRDGDTITFLPVRPSRARTTHLSSSGTHYGK